MAITDWPATERPREKLLKSGAAALSDAELLAIFLRTGLPGLTAVDLARQLLDQTGGLRALLELDQNDFCANKGLGNAKYAQLQAVLEMARRHLRERLDRGDALTSSALVRQYLQQQLRDYPHEVFACLFLDNRHRVIRYQEMFFGTIDSASVHPREVVRKALQLNAAAIICAHNHPSGIAEPSESDKMITLKLRDALQLVDVRLLDHFVIGDDVVSLSEQGMLS